MQRFHRKVNPKEGMVGLYKSGKVVDKDTIEIWYEYMQKLMANSKSAVLPQPLLLLIDPEMTDNKLAIKVLSFVSAPEIRKSEWEDEEGEMQTKLEQVQVFSECPFTMQIKEFEKTGLDVVFYGQDHYDTMAIMQNEKEIDYNSIPELKEKQKLYSNKDLMSKNFDEVIENLNECESYIQEVLDGKREGDSELGRQLEDCLAQFSTDDMALLESLVASNFEDALLVSSLSKLQSHQTRISGQINSLFSESIKTNTSHLQSKTKKEQK